MLVGFLRFLEVEAPGAHLAYNEDFALSCWATG